MIRDLSLSLRALLMKGASDLPELATANIVFDRPADSFNPSQATLSLFLFDVRENTELRSTEPSIDRSGGSAIIGRPPLRIATSYLVTAWSGKSGGDDAVLDEHLLLSQALLVFARNRLVPADCLQGALVGQQPDLPMIAAQAEGVKNPSEFWTALNNKLRPSLSVVVTFSMPLGEPVSAALAISSQIRLDSGTARRADFFRVGGRVTDGRNAAVPGAVLTLVERGFSTTADSEGRYQFGGVNFVPDGVKKFDLYTVRVAAGGKAQDFSVKVPPQDKNPYDMQLPM